MNDEQNKVLHKCIYNRATQIICNIRDTQLIQIPLDANEIEEQNKEIYELHILMSIEEELFDITTIKERFESTGMHIVKLEEEEDNNQFEVLTN